MLADAGNDKLYLGSNDLAQSPNFVGAGDEASDFAINAQSRQLRDLVRHCLCNPDTTERFPICTGQHGDSEQEQIRRRRCDSGENHFTSTQKMQRQHLHIERSRGLDRSSDGVGNIVHF